MLMLREDFENLVDIIDALTEAKQADWHKQAIQILHTLARDLKALDIKADAPEFKGKWARINLYYTKKQLSPQLVKPGVLGNKVVSLLKDKYGIKFAHRRRMSDQDGVNTLWMGGTYKGHRVDYSEWLNYDRRGLPMLEAGYVGAIYVFQFA